MGAPNDEELANQVREVSILPPLSLKSFISPTKLSTIVDQQVKNELVSGNALHVTTNPCLCDIIRNFLRSRSVFLLRAMCEEAGVKQRAKLKHSVVERLMLPVSDSSDSVTS